MAPLASVAARKVSANSFLMDYSFHELLCYPQEPLRIRPFYICAKYHPAARLCFLSIRTPKWEGNSAKLLNEQLEPLSGPLSLTMVKSDSARSWAIPATIWL